MNPELALLRDAPSDADPALLRLAEHYSRDEAEAVADLLRIAEMDADLKTRIHDTAADLVKRVRARKAEQSAVESFMRQYDLSSEEGVLLMCVAEALLRIPDSETADKLISDKLGAHNRTMAVTIASRLALDPDSARMIKVVEE